MTAASRTALITGASAGIGAIYADRLARRGWNLILAARSDDRLKEVAARVGRDGISIETIAVDLGTHSGQRRLTDRLREDPSIAMLVNNAGFGSTAPLLDSDPEVMAQMIELNVGAVARLANAAAKAFASRGEGTIVNMASIAAVAPRILNGVYGGTKAFVLALSQSLHRELTPKGVRVQVVLPGATATDFWAISGTSVETLPQEIVMSPEAVVDAALAGLDLGELVTLPSLPDVSDWQAFDEAREALLPNLSRVTPAPRYGLAGAAEAGRSGANRDDRIADTIVQSNA
jgi:short-subunit dehydrogenase